MAFRILRKEPALTPLFAAVGLGIVGSVGFAVHYLRNSPDVVIKKSTNPEPWNRVEQHTNSKLFSWNPDFYSSRRGVHPQAGFLSDGTSLAGDDKAVAKALAIRKHKALNAAKDDSQDV